jgi:hypothetical protein
MLSKKLVILFMTFISTIVNAQLTDLARLEYSFIPKSKSEDQYARLRMSFNYPIKLKEDNYLIVGAEYNRISLNLADTYPFDVSLAEKINAIDFNLSYTYKMNEKWRAGFKMSPRIASILTSKITNDDLFLNGGVFFINDRTKVENLKKPYRLILGLSYNTATGIPFPLPFVSYYRRLNKKWSYSAGVPKSNIKYFFNEKNNLQVFVGLDSYFAHLQKPITVLDRQVYNISLSVLEAGLGCEYQFTKHLVL